MSIVQKIIIAVSLVFSLATTGVFVYTQVIFKKPAPDDAKEFEKMKEEEKKPTTVVEGYKLKRMMINLESETGKEKIRLLNLEALIMPFKEDGATVLEDNQAIVYDVFNTVASKMDVNELNSISGKILLENRLRKTINERLHEEVVREILFQHFVIQ